MVCAVHGVRRAARALKMGTSCIGLSSDHVHRSAIPHGEKGVCPVPSGACRAARPLAVQTPIAHGTGTKFRISCGTRMFTYVRFSKHTHV